MSGVYKMKKLFIIGLILCVMLTLAVSAASITLDRTVIEDTKKPTAGFSHQFTITNNGTTNITDLKVDRVGTELNNFNISTSPHALGSTFALNIGSSVTLTLTGTVPDDITTKDAPYSDALKIYSGSIEIGSISLRIVADSQLELDNVKFLVDGSSKSIDEGDTRKDVRPGSKLEIKGDVRNTFSKNDGIVIEDVTVEITIKDIDDGDDLEESDDVRDIDEDDKEGFSVEFEIPEDVDADEYTVTILVEGDDENGAKHSVEWDNVKIKVEKDKHDIQITRVTVLPSKVSCSRNVNINVDLKNQGTNDEDEVVLRIENADLDISEEDTSIPEIEEGTGEDTEYSKTYSFKIGDDVRAGTYPIRIIVYYNTDDQSDSDTASLIVENCVVEEVKKEEEPPVVVVTPPTKVEEEEEPEIITTPITETTEVSLLQSNTYLFLLMGAIGVAVVVIIIMIIVLFTMRKRAP